MSYDRRVAYDEKLADRIRELVAGEPDLTEKKMFGGLSFLIGGNMAVAASGEGGVLVRVDPEESDTLVSTTNARLMEMRGRQMRGWLRVDSDDVRTTSQLAKWVELGTAYARSLPAEKTLAAEQAQAEPPARRVHEADDAGGGHVQPDTRVNDAESCEGDEADDRRRGQHGELLRDAEVG